jgi:hypothetical protein
VSSLHWLVAPALIGSVGCVLQVWCPCSSFGS